MKKEETKEESSAASTIQRLLERRKLTQEQYIGLNTSNFKTAEDRRLNNFNKLLINKEDKKGK